LKADRRTIVTRRVSEGRAGMIPAGDAAVDFCADCIGRSKTAKAQATRR
jgi:hypothetical protein